MKKWKLLTAVLAVLLTVTGLPVCASSVSFDPDRKGSIEIALHKLEDKDSNRKGVEFSVWKIGTVNEHGEPKFDERYGLGQYPADGASLDAAAKKLAGKVSGQPDKKGKTDANGKVQFTEMETGVYLITAAEKNPYGKISPFIIHLPYWDSTKGEAGSFIYEIKAEPKASPYPEEPQKPEKPEKPEKPSEPGDPTVKTGDDLQLGMYFALLAVSLTVLIILGSRRRKKEEERRDE